jgi:hypothetical protein
MSAGGLLDAAWALYAYGPQLALCLLFGYLAAREAEGSLLDWLAAAFLASLVPLAGPVVMLVLWLRERRRRPPAPAA